MIINWSIFLGFMDLLKCEKENLLLLSSVAFDVAGERLSDHQSPNIHFSFCATEIDLLVCDEKQAGDGP